MGSRLNFICLGDCMILAHDHRQCIEAIISHFGDLPIVLAEVRRIDVETGEETIAPWGLSDNIVRLSINEGALLIIYFTITKNYAIGLQSITFDTRMGSSVVTLSLNPEITNNGGLSPSKVIARLAEWAMEAFDTAALACGPELDLYEIGDKQDIQEIQERFSLDWRCWLSIITRRFLKRMILND